MAMNLVLSALGSLLLVKEMATSEVRLQRITVTSCTISVRAKCKRIRRRPARRAAAAANSFAERILQISPLFRGFWSERSISRRPEIIASECSQAHGVSRSDQGVEWQKICQMGDRSVTDFLERVTDLARSISHAETRICQPSYT